MTRAAKGGSAIGDHRAVTLFTVRFRHDYYNDADGQCPDFAVVPTPQTAQFIKRIGMSIIGRPDGFSVVVPGSRLAAMIDAIAQAYRSDVSGSGYWSSLTFLLSLRNDAFVGITAWPINTSPATQVFFADNSDVARKKAGLNLGRAGGLDAKTLLPAVAGAIACGSGNGVVSACDRSGRQVASVEVLAGVPASLNLAGLPYGRYRIEATPPSLYEGPPDIVHVPANGQTTGVIDLLLARPDATTGVPSAFPIASLPAPPPAELATRPATINRVDLIAQFAARETYWRYYVVPQAAGSLAGDLAISGKGATFEKSSDTLPNGDTAVLFSSSVPLPLRQRSPYRFDLDGHRRSSSGGMVDVRVSPLPAPAAMPVWPAASEPLAGASEMYVYV